MTEIRYNQTNTLGQMVLVVGVLALQALPAISQQDVAAQSNKSISGVAYRTKNSPSTYSHIGNPFSGEYNNAPEVFEQAVGNFYEQLLAHQEPLGDDFGRILHQNLWDLYES